MTRSTIDFGIDLGTTNSVVAVMDGNKPQVIKNTLGEEFTPSFVSVKERNGKVMVTVGTRAKQILPRCLATKDYSQVAFKFKKRMGQTEWRHQFGAADSQWGAPALSAEVLKYLLESVQSRLREQPKSIVITIPAAFTQSAYQATSKAAEMAGFEFVELLEEPVAAALAYGLQTMPEVQQDWLVYDLGGGTFDAALLHYEDGIFTILDHEGMRNLGGSNLDEEIVTHCLLPFYPTDMHNDLLWAVLGYWAEEIKISLGLDDIYLFDEVILGHELSAPIEITRDKVVGLGIGLFEPTVKICTELLERNEMTISQLQRVILVGGQTQAPFLREWLEMSLGVQLDISVDPLTAVAQGAAIYAGTRATQSFGEDEPGTNAKYELEVNAPSTATDNEILVAGTIRRRDREELADSKLSIKMQRIDQSGQPLWESDYLDTDEKGRFVDKVTLRPDDNLFKVVLKVEPGGLVDLARSQFSVQRQEFGVEKSTLARGWGVINSEGKMIWFFKRGDRFPDTKRKILYTTKSLKKGERGTMLNIPIVEGDEDLGELNTLNSYLQVRADDIRFDIPEGTEIEVSMTVDENRGMSIEGWIEGYDTPAESVGGMDLAYDSVKTDIDEVSRVVREVEKLEILDEKLRAVFNDIRWERQVAMLEDLLNRGSKENPDPWQRAKEILVGIKKQLWPQQSRLQDLINWKNHKLYCDNNVLKAKVIFDSEWNLPHEAISAFVHLMDDYSRAANEMDYQKLEYLAYTKLPDLFLGFPELRDKVGQGVIYRPETVAIEIKTQTGDTTEHKSLLTNE